VDYRGGGQVRIQRESNRLRGTYPLETADRWTHQDKKQKRPGEEHKLGTTEGETGHGKKAITLTSRESF